MKGQKCVIYALWGPLLVSSWYFVNMFTIICRCGAYKIHYSMSKVKVTLIGQRRFLPCQCSITSQTIVIYSWFLVNIITLIVCRCVVYKTRNFMSNVKVTESKRLYKGFDIWARHVAPGHLVLSYLLVELHIFMFDCDWI